MAKKSVIESTCDTCGKSVIEDFGPRRKAEFDLPKGWVHLRLDTRRQQLVARDLCDECSKPLMDIIKQNSGK
jgi:hypothetical protein